MQYINSIPILNQESFQSTAQSATQSTNQFQYQFQHQNPPTVTIFTPPRNIDLIYEAQQKAISEFKKRAKDQFELDILHQTEEIMQSNAKVLVPDVPSCYKTLTVEELCAAINHQKQHMCATLFDLTSNCIKVLLYKISKLDLTDVLCHDEELIESLLNALNYIESLGTFATEKMIVDMALQEFVGQENVISKESILYYLTFVPTISRQQRLMYEFNQRNRTFNREVDLIYGNLDGYDFDVSEGKKLETGRLLKSVRNGKEYKPKKEKLREKILNTIDLELEPTADLNTLVEKLNNLPN